MIDIMPNYLNKFAYDIQKGPQSISFMIKCECNKKEFFLLENEETIEEKVKREEFDKLTKEYDGGAYSDENGNIFLYSKGFLGIGRKKIQLQDSFIPFQTKVIKAICPHCGREIILFDNRLYGYDAIVDQPNNLLADLKFSAVKANRNPCEIFVKIRNDLSIEEYIETMKGAFTERYAEAFSDISIYSIANGRKKLIFEEETA